MSRKVPFTTRIDKKLVDIELPFLTKKLNLKSRTATIEYLIKNFNK